MYLSYDYVCMMIDYLKTQTSMCTHNYFAIEALFLTKLMVVDCYRYRRAAKSIFTNKDY